MKCCISGKTPEQGFCQIRVMATLDGKPQGSTQNKPVTDIDQDRKPDAEQITNRIKCRKHLMCADRVSAKMDERSAFIQLSMKKNRLNKEKLQDARNNPYDTASEKRCCKKPRQ